MAVTFAAFRGLHGADRRRQVSVLRLFHLSSSAVFRLGKFAAKEQLGGGSSSSWLNGGIFHRHRLTLFYALDYSAAVQSNVHVADQ